MRINGPRPHAAKATILTAGINFTTRGLLWIALYDLHDRMKELHGDHIFDWREQNN